MRPFVLALLVVALAGCAGQASAPAVDTDRAQVASEPPAVTETPAVIESLPATPTPAEVGATATTDARPPAGPVVIGQGAGITVTATPAPLLLVTVDGTTDSVYAATDDQYAYVSSPEYGAHLLADPSNLPDAWTFHEGGIDVGTDRTLDGITTSTSEVDGWVITSDAGPIDSILGEIIDPDGTGQGDAPLIGRLYDFTSWDHTGFDGPQTVLLSGGSGPVTITVDTEDGRVDVPGNLDVLNG